MLQNLLKELVSIRDLHTVLETLADVSTITKDPDLLTEHVRQSLSRQITRQYQTPDGVLPLITMNQDLENQIAKTKTKLEETFPFIKDMEESINKKSEEVKETVKETVSKAKETISKATTTEKSVEDATIVEETK